MSIISRGRKSINNGVTTGGFFWPRALRSSSRFARALVYRAGPANPPVLQAIENKLPIFHKRFVDDTLSAMTDPEAASQFLTIVKL